MHLQAPLSPLRSSLPRLPQLAHRITLRIRASVAAQIVVRLLRDTRMARLFAMDTSPSRKTGSRASSGPGSGSCSASRLFHFIRMRCVGLVMTFTKAPFLLCSSSGPIMLTSLCEFMQNSPQSSVVYLADVTLIDRVELKPYCLVVETKDRRMWLSLKSDEEVYGWKDDIYARSPLMGFSNPVNFQHKIHVGFDPTTGNFTVSDVPGCANNGSVVPLRSSLRTHPEIPSARLRT